MTDPKTATPSTDDCICEDVRVLGACPVHEPRSTEPANDDLVAAWLADLQGMDDADREHDVTVLDTRSLLYRIAADAETIKAARQERDAVKEALVEARETIHKQAEEIERLKGVHRAWINEDQASAELATAREQVRTLREALEIARKIIYTKTWDTDQHALDAMAAALAATEPKG